MAIACYARVSTADQSLARQLRSTLSFTIDTLDTELTYPGTVDDLVEQVETKAITSPVDLGAVTLYIDRATGTDTNRTGYRDLVTAVERGEYEAVVVHSVSRLSRSIRDLDSSANRIVEDNETALHILSESFDLVPGERDPFQRAMFRLLGVFAELEADLAQQRTKEGIRTRMADDDYHHGPAPLGFEKQDGYLIEADGYDRVRAVLELVQTDELSKRKAARELDTSRRTINRALDRAELYDLPE